MNTIYSRARSFPFSRMLWVMFNSLQLLFTLLWTAACISLALVVLLVTRQRRWPLRMASGLWAPGLLWGAGARLRIEGLENIDHERAQVLVANHQSIIDICALFRAVPVPLRFVLKQELAQVPFVGWYARAMGMVFIRRGSARSAAARLRDCGAPAERWAQSLCIPGRHAQPRRQAETFQGRSIPCRDGRSGRYRAGRHRRQWPGSASRGICRAPRHHQNANR